MVVYHKDACWSGEAALMIKGEPLAGWTCGHVSSRGCTPACGIARTVQVTIVPPLAPASTTRLPPIDCARNFMIRRPTPSCGCAVFWIPMPSSTMRRWSVPDSLPMRIVTVVALACFTTFVSASWAMRYNCEAPRRLEVLRYRGLDLHPNLVHQPRGGRKAVERSHQACGSISTGKRFVANVATSSTARCACCEICCRSVCHGG